MTSESTFGSPHRGGLHPESLALLFGVRSKNHSNRVQTLRWREVLSESQKGRCRLHGGASGSGRPPGSGMGNTGAASARRRRLRSKDTVEHPRNGHDDYANVVCGVLSLLAPPAFEQPNELASPIIVSRGAITPWSGIIE